MRLRPLKAHPFEIFTPRQTTVHVLELLARTGSVELDAYPSINAGLEIRPLLDALQAFDQMAAPYREYLPEHARRSSALNETAEQTVIRASIVLKQWIAHLDPMLQKLRELQAERDSLTLLQEYLIAAGRSCPDLAMLSQHPELLHKGLYACPRNQSLDGTLAQVFKEVTVGGNHRFLILIGLPDTAPEIESAVSQGTCLRVAVPEWFTQNCSGWRKQIPSRLAEIDHKIAALQRAIATLGNDSALCETLADIALLKWYAQQAAAIREEGSYCRISGWTSHQDPARLQAVLDQAGVDGIVRFFSNPETTPVPVKPFDTWWTRPFQAFIHLYGTPGSNEVDPGVVLIFVVPLLFGYMFPDVGHGLLLMLFSALLYRRWPDGRPLIPCGFSAVLFGFVFGEAFGFHHVVEPLWLSPLDDPMKVLLVPVFAGAGLITLGMLFAAIQSFWRGDLRNWLLGDAPLLVFYISVFAALFHPYGLFAGAGALAWFTIGGLILHRTDPAYRIGAAWGRLVENVFQLTLNTISFLRVGAFALAHAAISSAIPLVAESIPNRVGYWMLFILAHLIAISLETLVVFVQTTRLVFFEFFIRFLYAQGRIFKPLKPPQENSGF